MTLGFNILLYILAYLLGAIPFSIVVGKVFFKTDVRNFGSGNPGATNTLRTLGTGAGLAVLFLDMAKGFGAVLLVGWCSTWPAVPVHDRMTLAGALAIAGHVFSPFLRFKGGKGVATSIGVILALEPLFAAIIMVIFLVVLLTTRFVSLSSIVSAFAFTLLTLSFRTTQYIPVIFSICLTLLIIIKHKPNILRLMKGEENRFTLKKKQG